MPLSMYFVAEKRVCLFEFRCVYSVVIIHDREREMERERKSIFDCLQATTDKNVVENSFVTLSKNGALSNVVN